MHLGDALGTIEAGTLADLCIVSGNPLKDFSNTHNVRRVMVRGQIADADLPCHGTPIALTSW